MERLQAFKYELVPNGQQNLQMRRVAGACRFVFNKALALQKERYEGGQKRLGYSDLCKQLTGWKAEHQTDWLNDTPSQSLQQALKNLETAYKNFFEKRVEFPCFKKKGRSDSFRYPQGFKLDQTNSRIFLPKLGWLRYLNSRDVLGTVRNVTGSRAGEKWFVSIQTQRRMQQAMGRKVKFSSNWKKAKTRLQKIHARIANVRRDFLHKHSTAISQNPHAIVVVEDLQVRNISKSASGTTSEPGKNVRAKSGLNKVILDQGGFEFRRQLDYKLSWSGGWLIEVPANNTSRTCLECDHISADNRKRQALFKCVACGFEEHADLVGANNVLRAGYTRLACKVSGELMPPAAGTHRSDLGVNA